MHFLLTIIRGRWPPSWCLKSPQREFSKLFGKYAGDEDLMDFLSGLNLWGTGSTGWIIPFLVVLTIVVFFHELGHFLVARWCGVRVLVFSVGFGPELIGFNDRHGTRWKLSAIPLGGYVKFFG